MRSTTPLIALFAVTSAVLLSGCSAPADSEPGASERESPLSEYLNALYGGDLSEDEMEKKYAADEKEREALISTCMNDEGFEYIPAVQSTSFSSGGEEWLPDDREWVAQYGYGMTSYPGADDPAPTEEYVDPNQDYVTSLPESEQQAFYEALNGAPIAEEDLPADGSYEYNWEESGCYGFAQNEIVGEDPSQSEEHKPLFEAITAVYTDLEKAPEMADLNAAWSDCMSGAGYPGFSAQQDAQTAVSDEYNKLWEGQTEGGEPSEADMDALTEGEVETALADLECREKTNYRDAAFDVQADIEQKFIDDNKEALEALKADAEQGR